jgi:hypothetical protein
MTAQRVSIRKRNEEGEEEGGEGEDRYIERGGEKKSKKVWYENAPRLYEARVEGRPLCRSCSSCYSRGSGQDGVGACVVEGVVNASNLQNGGR